MLKACTLCGFEKPLDEFHRQAKLKDGRTTRCKSCTSLYTKAYREANRERIDAGVAAWVARNPERVKANRKRKYRRTRQKAIADARRWAVENPEMRRANARRYVKSEKGAANRQRHRYQLDKPTELWATVLKQDPCCYCGGPSGTIDHIIPQAVGGSHEWDNLSGSCRRCNSKKTDFSLLYWLMRRAELSQS